MSPLPELLEIKRLRKKLDISQKDLEEKLGINQSIISRIENGEIDPPYSKIKKIFEYLESEKKRRKKGKKRAIEIMTQPII